MSVQERRRGATGQDETRAKSKASANATLLCSIQTSDGLSVLPALGMTTLSARWKLYKCELEEEEDGRPNGSLAGDDARDGRRTVVATKHAVLNEPLTSIGLAPRATLPAMGNCSGPRGTGRPACESQWLDGRAQWSVLGDPACWCSPGGFVQGTPRAAGTAFCARQVPSHDGLAAVAEYVALAS